MGSITWKLNEFMTTNNIKPYALAKEIGVGEATIYRLAREGKAPERIDISTLGRLLVGLQTLTKKPVDLNDLFDLTALDLDNQADSRKTKKIYRKNLKGKPMAFILMPFDPDSTQVFELILKPSLEKAGYSVLRADSLPDQQNILRKIVEGIANANLILADLSNENPNVFYELGLCHGLGIETIMITRSIEKIPFDLKTYVAHQYSRDFFAVGQFMSAIQDLAEKHLNDEISFGNPISDFWPEKYDSDVEETVGNQNLIQKSDSLNQPEEKGFLDLLIEIESVMEELTKATGIVAQATQDVGNRASINTERIQKLNSSNLKLYRTKAYKIIEDSASDLFAFSTKLDNQTLIFASNVDNFVSAYGGLINYHNKNNLSEESNLIELKSSISGLIEGIDSSDESMMGLKAAISGVPKMTTNYTKASKKASASIEKITNEWQKLKSFAKKLIGEIDSVLS
jgi:DNA-binding Xre family transcriptional regulator